MLPSDKPSFSGPIVNSVDKGQNKHGEFVNGFNGCHPLGMDTSNPGNPDSRSSEAERMLSRYVVSFPEGISLPVPWERLLRVSASRLTHLQRILFRKGMSLSLVSGQVDPYRCCRVTFRWTEEAERCRGRQGLGILANAFACMMRALHRGDTNVCMILLFSQLHLRWGNKKKYLIDRCVFYHLHRTNLALRKTQRSHLNLRSGP